MNTDNRNKIEQAKIAMVPVMLQTIYNAKKALKYIKDGHGDLVDNGNCFGSINDCNVILEAFERIGEKVRFRKRKFEDGSITLRHLKYNENGDVSDIPNALREYKKDVDAKSDERIEELKRGILNAKAEAIAYRDLVPRDGWVPNIGDTIGKMVSYEHEKLTGAVNKLNSIKGCLKNLEEEKEFDNVLSDIQKALTRISYWKEYTNECLEKAKTENN